MMMSRKWDRIENICKGKQYDIFQTLESNEGDISDDLKDMVGYILLILDHMEGKDKSEEKVAYAGWIPPNEYTIPFTVEGHRGDGMNLYKCKKCGKEVWAKTAFEAYKEHDHGE